MKTTFIFIVSSALIVAAASASGGEPSLAETISRQPTFSTPLLWVGDPEPAMEDTLRLQAALAVAARQGSQAGFQAIENYVAANPTSAWTPALQMQLAEHARSIGRYSVAMSFWAKAWTTTKAAQDVKGRAIAARVAGGWGSLLASLGRKSELAAVLNDAKQLGLDQDPSGGAIQTAWEGLVTMRNRPEVSFRCGTYSLARVAREIQGSQELNRKIHELPSPDGGFNLGNLVAIATTNGLKMAAVRRESGAKIPVPSVVHWKLDHYAAILRIQDGFYFVKDPTFGGEQWMSAEIINEEASGNFLVSESQIPEGFRLLTEQEAALVHGKGCCNNPDDLEDDTDDDIGPSCPPPPPPTAGDGPGAGEGPECPSDFNDASSEQSVEHTAMPGWRVSEPFISLWLHDVPLYYRQSTGKPFFLKVSYKSRGLSKGPNVAGFGNNWECNWIGIIEDHYPINSGNPIVYITNTLAGGGRSSFPVDGTPERRSLRRGTGFSSTGIVNGWASIVSKHGQINKYGFKLPFPLASDRYFLTNRTDEFGRSIWYNYVSNYVGATPIIRLNSVTDMDGKQCTLGYTNTSYPNLITCVTNPYGQVAWFGYDHLGRLTNITDMAGMPSSFKYDQSGNIITNLHTPYGDTGFRHLAFTNTSSPNGAALHRAIEITEPSSDKQLYAYHDEVSGDIGYFTTEDGYPQYRNTFHWNRQQYATMTMEGKTNPIAPPTEDYRKASVKHWSHGETVGTVLQVMTAQAQAVPNGEAYGTRAGQMTYSYDGQSGPYHTGPYRLRQVNQIWGATTEYLRNDWGRPTNILYSRDGVMSGYTNIFNADGRRLLHVYGPRGEHLRGYEYANGTITNLLTAVTNADNQVLRYIYDAGLRVIAVTNWSGLVSSNIYFTSGTYSNFLQASVDVGYRTNSFTYTNGNIYTHTDELGLSVTNVWDSLNRLVCRVYPDGTTISNWYDSVKKLNLVGRKDRLNRWTYLGYNSLQQLTGVTNANNQVTLYDYCNCGSLSQVTRLVGGLAVSDTFTYDLAGRRTNASYADGYYLNYDYEAFWPAQPGTGALRITDSSGLIVHVGYGDYGRLTSVGLSHYPDLSADGYLLIRDFDEYGRLSAATDRNGVTVTNGYDALGRLTNRVTLDISGYPSNTVTYAYTARGLTNLTDELGHKTWFVYDQAGRLLWQTNANNEVLQFTYNPADQILTLLDGKSQQTSWNYDEYGRVTNKLDAVREIFRYKYDQNNRLTNRWTAEKGDTYYRYDPIGNLTNVDYPGTLMDIVLTYDPLNRLTNVTDMIGTTKFTYSDAGQLLSEDGPWADDVVSYSYDARRRSAMSVAQPNASAWSQSYGYDQYNRLSNIVSAAGEFVYTYWYWGGYALPDRVQTLGAPGFINNHTYIDNSFDTLGRLTSTILRQASGVVINQHDYQMNEGNQRTQQTFYDGNSAGNTHYVDYTYDNIGQLKTAKGTDHAYDSGTGLFVNSSRLNEQFGYAYDAAWNLNRRTNNALVQTFGVNNLNELTNATRSGTLTVAGLASQPGANLSSVSVSANGGAGANADVYADGSWAKSGVTLLNGNNSFNATATDTYGRTASDAISLSLPATNTFSYDYNGNLTNDGRRVFEYDYENQLTNVYVASAWRSEFRYDAFGRRRVRKEYTWQSSAWVLTNEVRYVYDGMLTVQERDANNLAMVSYTRGNDLSSTLQGAGGIGGLLARTANSQLLSPNSSSAHSYYHCDGNGNVTALVDTNGILVARYQYDPYGNLLGMSGPLAEANTYRFSSKEYQGNAALYYYGYRFYEPNLQRWLNRDPVQEEGGINLFAFVDNFPTGEIDFYGLDGIWITCADGSKNVIDNPSLDALTKELEKAVKDKNPITDLTIKGHGNSGEIKLNSKESLTTSGNGVLGYDKKKESVKDITDLMNKALSPNACVSVLGCSTGRGKDNLSQELSTALPNRTVIGSASFAQMNIPFQPATVGVKAVYCNGKREFRMLTK